MKLNQRQKIKVAGGVIGMVLFAVYPGLPLAFRLGLMGLVLIATVWAVWYRRDRTGI